VIEGGWRKGGGGVSRSGTVKANTGVHLYFMRRENQTETKLGKGKSGRVGGFVSATVWGRFGGGTVKTNLYGPGSAHTIMFRQKRGTEARSRNHKQD